MPKAQKLLDLSPSDDFENFNSGEIARLASIGEELELPKHHLIFFPGAETQAIYFIARGRVRLTRHSSIDGKSVLLALLGPGDLIGEAAWDRTSHDCTAETLEETKLYEIPKESFDNLVRANPDFALRLLEIVGHRLKQAQDRIEDLVFRQVPARIARLLLSLAESYGKVTPNGIRVEFRLTHQDIADLVGSSRVTVTQVLNRFRQEGYIDIESKRVTIFNAEALDKIVREPA